MSQSPKVVEMMDIVTLVGVLIAAAALGVAVYQAYLGRESLKVARNERAFAPPAAMSRPVQTASTTQAEQRWISSKEAIRSHKESLRRGDNLSNEEIIGNYLFARQGSALAFGGSIVVAVVMGSLGVLASGQILISSLLCLWGVLNIQRPYRQLRIRFDRQ